MQVNQPCRDMWIFLVRFLAGLQTALNVGAGLSSVKDINKSSPKCWALTDLHPYAFNYAESVCILQ